MSTDWTATALVGCEVTGKTTRDKTVRNCPHPTPPGVRFCPECGKPPFRIIQEDIPGLDQLEHFGLHRTFAGYDGSREWIGVLVRAESGRSQTQTESERGATCLPMKENDFARVTKTVREALSVLDLWDESTFGLWALLRGE